MLTKARKTRKMRIRERISGTASMPRLTVFRSNKFIYAQLVYDDKGVTMAAARGVDPVAVGEDLAKKALGAKIKKVVFDRSGYKYHGLIKALADAVRKGGIEF